MQKSVVQCLYGWHHRVNRTKPEPKHWDIAYARRVRMQRRRLWSIAPLAALIALGVPALWQGDTEGIPEISVARAKAILESDVQRRTSSPTVSNQFTWTSFEWKGEGDATFGSTPTTSPVRARFAKVNLTWTQTTYTRLGEVVSVTTYTTQPPSVAVRGAQVKVLQLPQVIAFFRPPQASWTYKWQVG